MKCIHAKHGKLPGVWEDRRNGDVFKCEMGRMWTGAAIERKSGEKP